MTVLNVVYLVVDHITASVYVTVDCSKLLSLLPCKYISSGLLYNVYYMAIVHIMVDLYVGLYCPLRRHYFLYHRRLLPNTCLTD